MRSGIANPSRPSAIAATSSSTASQHGTSPPPTPISTSRAHPAVGLVTNNPTKPPESYSMRLNTMGVEVGPERIVTAGVVASRLAAEAAGDVMLRRRVAEEARKRFDHPVAIGPAGGRRAGL